MVVSWLVHSVSLSIRHSILWMENADEIWKDLKSRYAQGDLLRVSDLQFEASSIKQGDLSVTEFFTKLRVVWDEIENFRPDPVCACTTRCTCNVLSIIAQRKLEDRAMQFLRGLNDQYNNVRSHVLLMDPSPPLSKIFSYVAQQERQLLGNNFMIQVNSETKGTMINAVNSSNACSYCGRAGHNENVCYCKHGFPLNNDNKGSKGMFNRNGKICTHCGKSGHTIDICYRKHGFPPGHRLYNVKNASVNSTVTGDGKVTDNDQQTSENQDLRFSPQQFQALLALIQQPSNGNSASHTSHVNQISSISSSNPGKCPSVVCSAITPHTTPWILDSGATDHVSSSLTNFSSYITINPIVVKLPTGQHLVATHSGTVKFTESFFLTDVLYIPSFTFNLISISKLVSSLKCELIFYLNSCVIQDMTNKQKIGTVDVNGGLYQITLKPVISHSVCTSVVHPRCNKIPIDLWHFRLGHIYHDRMQCMKQYYPCLISNKDFMCNTCHHAKQRRLPFPLSNSHASQPFEIMHMDIWGPCSTTSMHGHKYFLTVVDDHTHFCWIFLMSSKGETRTHIHSFINQIENQFGKTIKIIRSDNGV
uniref:Retrovirus-related Pol polyprotein from transposon TNT 1-94 n=1 Tax=Cajanus cajan TaxID=3821 RepID=A0A151SQG1_CAJCA|nr:Retrovirus-related Pol polyprotein from transposon TNT 1-94 [Cajanus cajan]